MKEAIEKLEKARKALNQLDLGEINEDFINQALALLRSQPSAKCMHCGKVVPKPIYGDKVCCAECLYVPPSVGEFTRMARKQLETWRAFRHLDVVNRLEEACDRLDRQEAELKELQSKYNDVVEHWQKLEAHNRLLVAKPKDKDAEIKKQANEIIRVNDRCIGIKRGLEAELKGLRDGVAAFNKGWEAAQRGEPKSDRMDEELHGWLVFKFDDIEAEVKRLKEAPKGGDAK